MLQAQVLSVFFLCAIGILNLEAVLSPLNQSAVEIKTIVEDKRLSEIFGESEEIENIRKTTHGYVITGIRHKVRVIVEYKKQNQPGSKPFELRFLSSENK